MSEETIKEEDLDDGLDISIFETLVEKSELKQRYEDFCRYMVLTGGNKSESQRLAGFSPKSGCKQAVNMLARPEVRERLAELQKAFDDQKNRNFLEAFMATASAPALTRHEEMASQNIADYMNEQGVVDVEAIAREKPIVKKFRYSRRTKGEGDKKHEDVHIEVEFPDQLAANRDVLKMTGAVEDKPTEVHVIISPEEDFSGAGTKEKEP
jgi:phage terminase small subunit